MTTPTPVPFADTSDITDLEESFQDELFQPIPPGARCDADAGEGAVAQALMPSGTVLLLCGHHFRKHVTELTERGIPFQVPEEDSKPFTERRAQELGGAQNRSQGDAHA